MDETLSDDALAQRAIQDTDAFALLYRRHLNRIYSYLLSRVGNVQDAQDLTTQTFIAVLNALPHYEPRGLFGAWLLAIARRKAMDHFRQDQTLISIEDAIDVSDDTPSPDEFILEQMWMEEVAHLFKRLNPDRAEAIRLRFFAELKNREIANLMGKSEGAVKMLIARGLEDIRHMTEQQEKIR